MGHNASLSFRGRPEAWVKAHSRSPDTALKFTTPTYNAFSNSGASPRAQQSQRQSPSRLRVQLHQMLDPSPTNPKILRQRRQKQMNRSLGDYTAESSKTSIHHTPDPDLEKGLGGIDILEEGELVWGPHADFEVDRCLGTQPLSEDERNPFRSPNELRQHLPKNVAQSSDGQAGLAVLNRQSQRPRSDLDPRSNKSQQYQFDPMDTKDPARKLSRWELIRQRSLFAVVILCLNAGCLIAALESHRHLWVLVLIFFVKAKDILSTIRAFC